MSILIRGMDKPTDCGLCPFEDFGYCNVKGERNTSESGVDADCPLIEVAVSTISKMEQVDEPKTQMKTQNSNLTFEKTDEPQIYGNEYNCIMTMFGDCSYAETGCGSCEVVEKVRKALDEYEPKTEPQTHEIRTNTHECVKDTHDKTEPQKKCHRDEEYACHLYPNEGACNNCKLWYKTEPQTEDPKPISLYDSQRDYDYDLALDKMDCPWK